MMDQKQIILFGCGEIGYRLLQYFGKRGVFAFCDNSCNKRGVKYGVDLIPYEELKEIASDYILVLSVNPQNAGEIINQLTGDDIRDFVVYDSVFFSKMKRNTPDEFLSILNDDGERLSMERDYLYRRLNYKNEQLAFLESISDIHKLNDAKGYISAVKEKLKDYVRNIFEFLSALKIKPFTAAGTAIGLYRHGGFIPWDDDVDFGLFRKDYDKLIKFGREHLHFIEVSLGVEGYRLQTEYFKKYPDEYVMILSPSCLQIKKGTSWIDSNTIDFFPYDFYEDGFDYEKHLENIKEVSGWRRLEAGTEKITKFIEAYGHTCTDSNTVSFGLDGMDPYVCPQKGWMKREVMLPLRETVFEGISCWAPSKLKEYLSYCYQDFEGYPSDIGALHSWDHEEVMKSFYISIMIIVEDEDFSRFNGLYHKFRGNGVYCLYLLNRRFLTSKSDYDSIRNKIIEAEVQYTDDIDMDFDCFIARKDVRSIVEFGKTVYDSALNSDFIFNCFVEDLINEKFDKSKSRLCLLYNGK